MNDRPGFIVIKIFFLWLSFFLSMFCLVAFTDKWTQNSCRNFAVQIIHPEISPGITGVIEHVFNELCVPGILQNVIVDDTSFILLFSQNAESVNIKFPRWEEILFLHLLG